MEGLDYWRLCDELTVIQAALLTVGVNPSGDGLYVEGRDHDKRPDGYEATKDAISKALRHKQILGEMAPQDTYGTIYIDLNNPANRKSYTVDVAKSTVVVESLKKWLSEKGVRSDFFFPEGPTTPYYLDPSHDRYAPKLAAAVKAWEATEDPSLVEGKTPKQALTMWLRENASEFGLADENGKPNESAIKEVAKVGNWRPEGGAPKTSGQ